MDDPLLAPYERLAASRAEMAAEEGISVRTLQRRLQRQREAVQAHGVEDLPAVPLVDRAGPDRYQYRLDHDQASVLPTGLFRVGKHFGRGLQVQHANDGKPIEKPKESKHKHRPKIDGKRVG